MRAVYAFIVQGFRQQSAYRVEGWIGIGTSLIFVALYTGLWTALLSGDPAALQLQMAYVIAARFLSELHFLPTWEVAEKFRQGDVGLELIKPLALPLRILGDFFGRSLFRILRSTIPYLLLWVLFRLPAPEPAALLLAILSGLVGWIILSTMVLSLSLIALWTVQFNEAEQFYYILLQVLSGSFIPLYYLPDVVARIARYLPFAGIYFVPSAIVAGTLTGPSLGEALVLQLFWALVGVYGLTAMWRAGSHKLVMQGG